MKRLFSIILCAFMIFTCAAFPAYADNIGDSRNNETKTTFVSDGQEFVVETYTSTRMTRISGGAERTMGIKVSLPNGTVVYDVSCTFTHKYNSSTNYVDIVSMRKNVNTDAGYGFSSDAISYLVSIGVKEAKLTVYDKYGAEKSVRTMRCYSDGHTS